MVTSALLFYFKRTTNLCLYQLGKKPLDPTLCFPKASTVTLINCSREGISHILKPSIFPHLNKIHYLSGYPAVFDVHTRFNNVEWLFPTYRHHFYQSMIQAGLGRVENRLIRSYVSEFESLKNGCHMELNIPGYGMADGQWYARYQNQYLADKILHQAPHSMELPHEYSYLYTPNPNLFEEDYPYFDCGSEVQSYSQDKMDKDFLEYLKREDKK